ncbi:MULTISPECIES: hypothetical protein [unclassified Stenotrophomonas]|uniref:hypothetical protein n=1 Tax=unclassified Stenotrophomonas TaxID=196198 RepID=UPI003BF7D64F
MTFIEPSIADGLARAAMIASQNCAAGYLSQGIPAEVGNPAAGCATDRDLSHMDDVAVLIPDRDQRKHIKLTGVGHVRGSIALTAPSLLHLLASERDVA